MSLGINTTTPDGIVLAADSRQSYRNRKNMSRIGSDSASKIFRLGDRAGIIVAGLAFLPENGELKNISRFIEEFRSELYMENKTILENAERLKEFFGRKYDYKEQLGAVEKQITSDLIRQGCKIIHMDRGDGFVKFRFKNPDGAEQEGLVGVDRLDFIFAGYNADNSHQVSLVHVPGAVEKSRDSTEKGREYGASWIGQTDVLTRIVLGFDPRIQGVPFVAQAAHQLGADELQKQLRGLEYVIQWGTMTLQDAIDFSATAIQTTAAVQRFSDGIQADQGDMPGVGGPTDVAVITREQGFVWVSKKNLNAGDNVIDLEEQKGVGGSRAGGRTAQKHRITS